MWGIAILILRSHQHGTSEPGQEETDTQTQVLMNLSEIWIKPHLKPDLVLEFSVPRTDTLIYSPPHLLKSLLRLVFLSLATEFSQLPV